MDSFSFYDLEKSIKAEEEQRFILYNNELEEARRIIRNENEPWKTAHIFFELTHHDLFTTEFKDLGEFAAWAGVSRPKLSIYCKALEYAISHGISESISIYKVYSLSMLGENYKDFMSIVESHNIRVQDLSDKRIEELVKSYENGLLEDELDE